MSKLRTGTDLRAAPYRRSKQHKHRTQAFSERADFTRLMRKHRGRGRKSLPRAELRRHLRQAQCRRPEHVEGRRLRYSRRKARMFRTQGFSRRAAVHASDAYSCAGRPAGFLGGTRTDFADGDRAVSRLPRGSTELALD